MGYQKVGGWGDTNILFVWASKIHTPLLIDGFVDGLIDGAVDGAVDGADDGVETGAEVVARCPQGTNAF